VPKLHEAVDIEAPAVRVWAVVVEDANNANKWATNLERVEQLDDGPPGKGTRYRYHVKMPGGQSAKVGVEQSAYTKPKKIAGKFIEGPLKGTWSYTFTSLKDGSTRLAYDMDYEMGGFLRFAGGLLAGQYADGFRKNLESLKRYVESGKGPKH
jgi:uncharacterized membrane protein